MMHYLSPLQAIDESKTEALLSNPKIHDLKVEYDTGLLQARETACGDSDTSQVDHYWYNDPYDVMWNKVVEIDDSGLIIFNVMGNTVERHHWYDRHMDQISYQAIQSAAMKIAADEKATEVLVHMNTHGGHVAGMNTARDALKIMRNAVEERGGSVHIHTSSVLASAGYYLSTAFDTLSASSMSQVGSIGAAIIFQSHARRLKENKVDIYIARSGKNKMSPSPYEELTEEGKKKLDNIVEGLAEQFYGAVEEARGNKVDDSKSEWETADVYMADKALSMGLIDRVIGFYEIFKELSSNLAVDHTEEEEVNLQHTEFAGVQRMSEENTAVTVDRLVALTEEKATLQAQLAEATGALTQKDEQAVAVQKQLTNLTKIACLATQKMEIALGHAPVDYTDFPVEAVLKRHDSLVEKLESLPTGSATEQNVDDDTKDKAGEKSTGLRPI